MNKRTYFIYRFLTITSLSGGLMLNLLNTCSPAILMRYYTMQSNLICLIALIFLPLLKRKYENIYYICKGAITIAIILTATIYLTALLPKGLPMYNVEKGIIGKAIGDLLVHVISPTMVTVDFFLFDMKGQLKLYYPFLWMILPGLYACFVYIIHLNGKHFYSIGGSRDFAYFFLDYNKIGVEGVICCMIAIALFIILLGYVFIIFDRKLAKVLIKRHA